MRISAASTSVILHLVAMALMFWIGYSIPRSVSPRPKNPTILRLTAPRLRQRLDPGGSGGRSPLPARQGRPPVPVYHKVFVPPMVPLVSEPKLPVAVAMLDAPEIHTSFTEIGDPLSASTAGLSGRNGLLGIGDAPGGKGIGPGKGNGIGGSSAAGAARITRAPEVLYRPEPEYSEEARKARYQGVVVLSVEIGTDGRTSNIHVIGPLGFGLDEKAIQAVAQWQFRPALSGDHPIAVNATVEVGFHLL